MKSANDLLSRVSLSTDGLYRIVTDGGSNVVKAFEKESTMHFTEPEEEETAVEYEGEDEREATLE